MTPAAMASPLSSTARTYAWPPRDGSTVVCQPPADTAERSRAAARGGTQPRTPDSRLTLGWIDRKREAISNQEPARVKEAALPIRDATSLDRGSSLVGVLSGGGRFEPASGGVEPPSETPPTTRDSSEENAAGREPAEPEKAPNDPPPPPKTGTVPAPNRRGETESPLPCVTVRAVREKQASTPASRPWVESRVRRTHDNERGERWGGWWSGGW